MIFALRKFALKIKSSQRNKRSQYLYYVSSTHVAYVLSFVTKFDSVSRKLIFIRKLFRLNYGHSRIKEHTTLNTSGKILIELTVETTMILTRCNNKAILYSTLGPRSSGFRIFSVFLDPYWRMLYSQVWQSMNNLMFSNSLINYFRSTNIRKHL